MPKITRHLSATPLLLLTATLVGCGTPDERLVEMSERSLARQAEQNQLVAKQSTEVAQVTHQLIEADAKSRQELITAQTRLQQDMQSERRSLDRQHQDLETERKQLAAQRLTYNLSTISASESASVDRLRDSRYAPNRHL